MPLHRPFLRCAALALLVVVQAASAAPQWCTGKAQRVLQDKDGTVHLYTSYRNDWTQICNSEVAWNGVTPSICKSWLATAKAAVAAGLTVTVQYPEAPACHQLPAYGAAPGPSYIMLVTPGLE
ncbi:hypothetical protein [Mitsuaria sp. GD03876]|uniref:hypothetical protein n=1 Tax=Mitsuaria sp. GD03876 TaxID=2975399 RepID=UPI00244702D7|nr:hypothetical protein [Mitsuaria sp. GD03876]MDH0866157.1 hypothetical protein [Mitsuaria sp. GD03876]